MAQLRCAIPSQQENVTFLFQDQSRAGEHIKPKKPDIYTSVLRTDTEVQMSQQALGYIWMLQ